MQLRTVVAVPSHEAVLAFKEFMLLDKFNRGGRGLQGDLDASAWEHLALQSAQLRQTVVDREDESSQSLEHTPLLSPEQEAASNPLTDTADTAVAISPTVGSAIPTDLPSALYSVLRQCQTVAEQSAEDRSASARPVGAAGADRIVEELHGRGLAPTPGRRRSLTFWTFLAGLGLVQGLVRTVVLVDAVYCGKVSGL